MTTPRTNAGKAVVIVYGLLGCSGTILFFNLFLERIVTFIAHVLKLLHERNTRRRKTPTAPTLGARRSSGTSMRGEEGEASEWKPSVYRVMLILLFGAVAFTCSASAVYRKQENWTYVESLYFCFVAFSTVGFGDYVINQRPDYPGDVIYGIWNFFVVLIGCCVVYSLFNVTSIVIKQPLNAIIRKLNCRCPLCRRRPCIRRHGNGAVWRIQQRAHHHHPHRRNAVAPVVGRTREGSPGAAERDSNHDSDGCSRRGSSEISMRDFQRVSKITMAIMQKQLYETAHRGAERAQESGGFQGGVGPLAILNHTLYPEEI